MVVVVEDEFNRIKRHHSTSWMTAAQHLVAVLWILSAMGPVLSSTLVRVLCCACVCACVQRCTKQRSKQKQVGRDAVQQCQAIHKIGC